MVKWLILVFLWATSVHGAENVLMFAGSARGDSLNKKLVKEAAKIAIAQGKSVTLIDLKHFPLPIYDGDLETSQGMPRSAREIQKLMIGSDAIFIASPEYNASITPLLKNLIDWTSRSEEGGLSREAFLNKTFVLLSASPGPKGGEGGLVHLRTILESMKGNVLSTTFLLPNAHKAFNQEGRLTDPATFERLKRVVLEGIK